jgi:hypothetical protein
MIVLNKHQQRRPFGGHHFPEQAMVVRGDTFDALVAKVHELRIINGRPVGDPEKEILRYYAEHFPYMVKSGADAEKPIIPSNYLKWRDWIRYVWYQPPAKSVSRKEASTRWEKCLACPMNEPRNWSETEESAEFGRRAFMLRAGQDIPNKLGFCTCHRWDNGVVVFVDAPEKYSNKREDDKQPSGCFLASDGR